MPKSTLVIPAYSLITVVSSGDPVNHPSHNIPAALRAARSLAREAGGATVYGKVIKGNLWRGPARIIVNW